VDINKRIKYLEDKIIQAKKTYYSLNEDNNSDEMELLDSEYDLLEDELRSLDPNNKVLSQVGVEDTNVNFNKVHHKYPMLSMEKANCRDDIITWYENKLFNESIRRSNLIIEPKIDGTSGDLLYIDGELIRASTRGNGTIGYEIKSEFFSCIPKKLKTKIKGEVYIRGEFHIPVKYILTNVETSDLALRNICNGAMKRKEYDDIHKEIKFVAYQMFGYDNFEYESEKIDFIKDKLGFDTVVYKVVEVNDKTNIIDSIMNFFDSYNKSIRKMWPYETDGLVIKFNSTNVQELIEKELGSTDHHNKYNIALKPPSEGGWTTIIDVDWNTSKSGDVIPTAVVTPIKIGAVTVSRAQLYNKSYIDTMDIKLYDKVYAIRANDVIPKIIKSKHNESSSEIKLTSCPSCGNKLIMKGVNYHCNNYNRCPSQTINKFIHWFESCDIKHLGESSINTLINVGHFYNLWELYAMSSDDLLKVVEKFVGISKETNNMKEFIKSFEESKNQTEQEIIGNYGIPAIGLKTLVKYGVETLNDLIKYKNVNYMNSDIAFEKNICIWLNEENNFDNLFSLVKFINPKKKKVESNINKKQFCISGAFINKKRNTVIKEIESTNKWIFNPTVNRETDLLIVGNDSAVRNKVATAMQLKTKIINLGDTFDINKLKDIL